MTESQEILFGIASQKLVIDVPMLDGAPTSVTSVEVREDCQSDTAAAESATTGSPSVESVSLTFNAASGRGQTDPKKLNLGAVTGLLIDRQFLATSAATGEREVIEIAKVDSTNTDAYARTDLEVAFASADTLVSCQIQVTVDTTWVSETSKQSDSITVSPRWRVRWVYVVGGVTKVIIGWFDVVRANSAITVTPADIEAAFPGLLSQAHTDDQVGQGRRLIARARRALAFDLAKAGRAKWVERNTPLINEIVIHKVRVLVEEMHFDHGGQNQAQLDRADKEYWSLFNLITEPKTNQQVTADGAGGPPQRMKHWKR